jgi:DNA-binding MarR family transcriptional regulator
MSSGTMMGTRWLTDVQQVQWRAYLDASVRLMNTLGRQLEQDSDLSLSEYEVLVQLSESPGRTMRMSQLAAEVVNSRSRLTHTVRRMEERGLVERQSCVDDGRGVNCVLTPEGFARLEEAAPGHVAAVCEHLVDRLDAEQFRTLGELMDKVGEALRES